MHCCLPGPFCGAAGVAREPGKGNQGGVESTRCEWPISGAAAVALAPHGRCVASARMRSRRAWSIGAVLVAMGVAIIAVAIVSGRRTNSSAGNPVPASSQPTEPSPSTRPVDPREQLPDLDQEVPSDLDVHLDRSKGKPSYRLGFRSAVRNIGAGPLIVKGARADRTVPRMTVDQIIERGGLPPTVVSNVGRMQYAVSPDHSHWHYLQFERYGLERAELRAVGGDAVIVADHKTGFCLGDRYHAPGLGLAHTPPLPVYTGRCGLFQPGLLEVREGISVGYGDDYAAFLEGQDLPLDGLAAGRYVLVHRVNSDRRLRERSYANNVASLLIDLRWTRGAPHVRVLASCPGVERCAPRK